jgi:hypothetical protein
MTYMYVFVQEKEHTIAMLKEEVYQLMHNETKEEQEENALKIKTSNISA